MATAAANGDTVTYRVLDVRDAAAVAAFVAGLGDRHLEQTCAPRGTPALGTEVDAMPPLGIGRERSNVRQWVP